jgi:hypothetical protein
MRKLLAAPRALAASLRTDRPYWLLLAGGAACTRGIAMMHEPAAWIVAGAGLVAMGLLMATTRRGR